MAVTATAAEGRSVRVPITEVCRDLGISRSLAYEMLRQQRIPCISLGRRRKIIPRAAYDHWLSTCGGKVTA